MVLHGFLCSICWVALCPANKEAGKIEQRGRIQSILGPNPPARAEASDRPTGGGITKTLDHCDSHHSLQMPDQCSCDSGEDEFDIEDCSLWNSFFWRRPSGRHHWHHWHHQQTILCFMWKRSYVSWTMIFKHRRRQVLLQLAVQPNGFCCICCILLSSAFERQMWEALQSKMDALEKEPQHSAKNIHIFFIWGVEKSVSEPNFVLVRGSKDFWVFAPLLWAEIGKKDSKSSMLEIVLRGLAATALSWPEWKGSGAGTAKTLTQSIARAAHSARIEPSPLPQHARLTVCDQQDAALIETARNLEASWLVALADCHDLKGLFQFTLPIPCRSIGTEADPWKLLLGCKAGLTHINQEFQNFCLLAHTHKSNPAGKKRSSWRQCSVGNSTYYSPFEAGFLEPTQFCDSLSLRARRGTSALWKQSFTTSVTSSPPTSERGFRCWDQG